MQTRLLEVEHPGMRIARGNLAVVQQAGYVRGGRGTTARTSL